MSTKLTNKQYREQYREKANASDARCPFCNSQNLEWDNIDVEGIVAKQEVWCLDCEKEWYDVYKLTGYEEK